tara:strand:+ start:5290 stop:5907 length:618 start_codon:yes stop_codon:yes gene_type:complete
MGFLQLNRNYHIDKPIIIKLLENPDSIDGLAKEFNGKTFLEFSIEVENIGQKYFTQGKDSYKINAGQKVDFKMSDSLYKKIVNFQENELVYINMKPRSSGGFLYDIKPATKNDIDNLNSQDDIEKEPAKNNKSNDDNRGLEIKWGMAFNNATRLVAQSATPEDELEVMVDEIKRIIIPMFQVACGMEKAIDYINKKEKDLDDEEF